MAEQNKTPKSTLRKKIMMVFAAGIIATGLLTVVMSRHVLYHTLTDSALGAERVEAISRDFSQVLAGFALVGIVLAVLVAAVLSRLITAPIRRCLDSIAKISAGDANAGIDISGDDELGRLAEAFDEMARRLRQSHKDFGNEVAHHTSKLSSTNEVLEREIAERTRAENDLKESLSLLEATLESTADGILVTDMMGKIKSFNRQFKKLWHLPDSVLESRDDEVSSFVLDQLSDPDAFLRRVKEIYRQPEKESFDVLQFTDGRVFERYSKPQIIGSRIVGRVWSFRDITERRRAEEKLQTATEEWATTFNSIAEPVSIQNASYEIVRVNKAFAQTFGKEPEKLLGKKCYAVVHGTDRPWPACPHGCTLQDGAPHTEVFFEPRLSCHIEVATYPILDKEEQIEGTVHIIKNIEERKQTEERQALLIERLEAVNEELQHFAYVISHDLKAPLRGIRLLAEWLHTDCGERLGEEGAENLLLLQNRVDRMHNLIDGVLQYSRVGRIREETTAVDLAGLVPSIMDAIAPPEHVTVTVEGPLPTIACEQTRITQVFQNLLTNAVKYLDKPAGEIVVTCADQGDTWLFRVSDNGPGIEPKHFDRIFRIFQTLAPRDAFESTGVGLTLVKKIVELYGGTVWVESEVGQGSTFFFTFPKQQPGCAEEQGAVGASCSEPAAGLPGVQETVAADPH